MSAPNPERGDDTTADVVTSSEQSGTLAAEQAIFELLQKEDFAGPEWEMLATELAEYGLTVLDAWVRRGEIFNHLNRHEVRFPASARLRWDLATDATLRDELVNSAVAEALIRFRQNARAEKGWRPDGGASLASYFITGCVYAAGDALKRLDRERNRRLEFEQMASIDDLESHANEMIRPRNDDPAQLVIDQDLIHRWLADLPERDRVLVQAKASGYSHAEIAELLDVTVKAVERRWARLIARHEGLRKL